VSRVWKVCDALKSDGTLAELSGSYQFFQWVSPGSKAYSTISVRSAIFDIEKIAHQSIKIVSQAVSSGSVASIPPI